jgi:hypothetical protein
MSFYCLLFSFLSKRFFLRLQSLGFILLLVFYFLSSSCVSVEFKNSTNSQPLKSLSFKTPPSWPYKTLKLKDSPHYHFQHQDKGHIISIQSICPSHDNNLQQELSSLLTQVTLETKKLPFLIDEREARETLIQGYKESIPFKIHLVQYEKLSCMISAFYMRQEENQEIQEKKQNKENLDLKFFYDLILTLKAKP